MKKSPASAMPAFFAVAFVWFTTHFGGGFASGRQLVQFFVQYGWYALFTPIIAMLLNAVIFYFVWDFSVSQKKFDYKSWCDGFYSPYEKIFTPLYEIVFNLTLFTATAVAFATGGATLTQVIGTPYILNTAVIAIIMFIVTIYGADMIRAVASWIAIIVIAGLLLIYGSNFIAILPNLREVIATAPAPQGTWPPLWEALKYGGLQASVLGSYVAVADVLKDKRDVKKAAVAGFILNAFIIGLAAIVILSYYPAILTEAVPVIYVINNGVGGRAGELLVSVLIFLGVISTGVNLIYGGAKRVIRVFAKEKSDASDKKAEIIASAVYVLLTWGIALFGLIPLVAKGYGYIGYISIPAIVIPVLYMGFMRKNNSAKASNM
ncbi:hypothetical protein [Clostridium formicaceticum]|uniref:Membrane protein YkvI n=1 Tax=Clostridium formicaceticum TaxID=1497 RepID=A0AAC9RKT7_9CLOT|nr:hypothetical protein [Clostridium formicaceticum]AOY75779.1 hypothetical protein BJL90_07625 [Clostridium formicaceticum]ARE86105.1 hypothetical protein CLFO_04210 [Clostridium formicaceticum]